MSVTVTLGMTTWNMLETLALPLGSLRLEASRLDVAGFSAHLYVADNASTDGTEAALRTMQGLDVLRSTAPRGSGVLRNLLMDRALLDGSTYTVFIDGDITVIPHSIVAAIHYLEANPELSALAFNPLEQTQKYEECSDYCKSIWATGFEPLMYLCGYGIFRTSVWNQVRFDEQGPLADPGWGSEDDDLWLQMVEADLSAAYAIGYRYYHARPRSSWDSLKALGLDPMTLHQARRDYLFSKWRGKRSEKAAPLLNLLKSQYVL